MGKLFRNEWELHDDKGMIMKGDHYEMTYAFSINTLADWAFKEIYGDIPRNPKYIIKECYGSLRLIYVDEVKRTPGLHTWEETGFE